MPVDPPSVDGPIHPSVPQLEITGLVPVVQELCATGIALATERVYRIGEGRFIRFCTQTNLPTYPVSERVLLLLFAAHLHTQNLVHGTIKSYLAAIHHGQILSGLSDPQIHQMSQLENLLIGIRRATLQSTRTRLPIIPQVLKRVWQQADRNEARLLWAAPCLCFFGFWRSGEVTVKVVHWGNSALILPIGESGRVAHTNGKKQKWTCRQRSYGLTIAS